MRTSYSLSIVITVYNSEYSLPELIQRLHLVLNSHDSPIEIILVNDDSHDRSWDVIMQLSKEYDDVRGINLMRNFGQHNALLCGIRAARHKIIVTMDDDLQHPPEEIPTLLDKLNEGYDVVYGYPEHGQQGLWRILASRTIRLALQTVMGAESAQYASPFRAFRSQVRNAFSNYQSPFVFIDVLLTWGTSRFSAVPIRYSTRKVGESNYNLRKLIILAITMLTGFSDLPLKFASLIGFVFTLFGLGVLLYVVGRFLITGYSVPGFPFLASIVAIFSGAQLFALGIIGEYLARMHYRLMERPPYVVSQLVEAANPPESFDDDTFDLDKTPGKIMSLDDQMIVKDL